MTEQTIQQTLQDLKGLISAAGIPLFDKAQQAAGLAVEWRGPRPSDDAPASAPQQAAGSAAESRKGGFVIESRNARGHPREFVPAEVKFLSGKKFIGGLVQRGVNVDTLGKMFGYVETNRRKQGVLRSLSQEARRALAQSDLDRTLLWESLDPDRGRSLPASIDQLLSAEAKDLPRIYTRIDISVWPPRRSIIYSEWTVRNPTLGEIRVDHVVISSEVGNQQLRAILKGLVPEESIPAEFSKESFLEILAKNDTGKKLFHASEEKSFTAIIAACEEVRTLTLAAVHSADQNRPLSAGSLVEHATYTMTAGAVIFESFIKRFSLAVQGQIRFAWTDSYKGPQVYAIRPAPSADSLEGAASHVARQAPDKHQTTRGSALFELHNGSAQMKKQNADLQRVASLVAKAKLAATARSVTASLQQLIQSIATTRR